MEQIYSSREQEIKTVYYIKTNDIIARTPPIR